MSYEKLKKEEIIAILEERDNSIESLKSEIKAGIDATALDKLNELSEENNSLREAIKDLQKENAKLSGREVKAPIIKIDGKTYYLNAKQINYKGSVVSASDLIENPKGKFNDLLELLVKKGSELLKEIED